MSVEIRVPQLGESVVEATVARWLKQPGEAVSIGDALVELETDKVNVEVPAEHAGVLERADAAEGATVKVGDVLGLLNDAVGQGDRGTGGQTAASVGTPLAASPAKDAASSVPTPPNGAHISATPVARKLAEENRLDLRQIKGSGPHGRITKEDVATHIERSAEAPETANRLAEQAAAQPRAVAPAGGQGDRGTGGQTAPPPSPAQRPTPNGQRQEERIRMSRRRQTIAARLKEALNTAAMLTTFNEADMSAVMEMRRKQKESFKERHGVGLGFMSFFTRACVAALKAFPNLNAEIQGDEIVLKRYYDIGVAVSTEDGLVVPVVRDADQKSFAQIEKDIVDLATRAREGKLTLPELMGGTFTITNGGIFGSLMSTPILNTPQVGILGMHKIQERPVVVGGQIVARPMMYLALSYDHRIVDGAEAVRFLVKVKELIEDPSLMLLEG